MKFSNLQNLHDWNFKICRIENPLNDRNPKKIIVPVWLNKFGNLTNWEFTYSETLKFVEFQLSEFENLSNSESEKFGIFKFCGGLIWTNLDICRIEISLIQNLNFNWTDLNIFQTHFNITKIQNLETFWVLWAAQFYLGWRAGLGCQVHGSTYSNSETVQIFIRLA